MQRRYVVTCTVRTWDPLTRFLHWGMMLSLMALLVTGGILWNFWKEMPNPMRWQMDVWHFAFGYAFAIMLLARIIWLFAGPPIARWRNMVPITPEQRRALRETLASYLSGGRKPVSWHGHNPVAGPVYLGYFVLAAVQVGLGLALSRMPEAVREHSPLLRWHVWGFFLLTAFVIVHIIMVVVHEIIGRSNLVSAMIHGQEIFTRAEFQVLQKDLIVLQTQESENSR